VDDDDDGDGYEDGGGEVEKHTLNLSIFTLFFRTVRD
jgi:hypothetical protein